MAKQKVFALPESLANAFRDYCNAEGQSQTGVVSKLIYDLLKDYKKDAGVKAWIEAYERVCRYHVEGKMRGRGPEFNPFSPL